MVDKAGNKTGGRQKGQPNKRTQALAALIEEHHSGFDPAIELINIFKNTKTSPDLKVSILKDLMSYIYPKRKSVEAEISGNIENSSVYSLDTSIEELIFQLRQGT